MKPIETRYNGHRFRSRTEARWAVFFDTLKISYEYEPEGFEFDCGTRYLPDFYLPREGCYIEVKGADPTAEDIEKAGLLAFETRKFVDVLCGQPGNHKVVCVRPRRPISEDLDEWLRSCPDERTRNMIAAHLAKYVHVAPDLRSYRMGDRVVGGHESRFIAEYNWELDYDPASHRLAGWKLFARPSIDYFQLPEYGIVEPYSEKIEALTWSWIPFGWKYDVDDGEGHQVFEVPAGWCAREEVPPPPTNRHYADALAAASSARFEFGEAGVG